MNAREELVMKVESVEIKSGKWRGECLICRQVGRVMKVTQERFICRCFNCNMTYKIARLDTQGRIIGLHRRY